MKRPMMALGFPQRIGQRGVMTMLCIVSAVLLGSAWHQNNQRIETLELRVLSDPVLQAAHAQNLDVAPTEELVELGHRQRRSWTYLGAMILALLVAASLSWTRVDTPLLGGVLLVGGGLPIIAVKIVDPMLAMVLAGGLGLMPPHWFRNNKHNSESSN